MPSPSQSQGSRGIFVRTEAIRRPSPVRLGLGRAPVSAVVARTRADRSTRTAAGQGEGGKWARRGQPGRRGQGGQCVRRDGGQGEGGQSRPIRKCRSARRAALMRTGCDRRRSSAYSTSTLLSGHSTRACSLAELVHQPPPQRLSLLHPFPLPREALHRSRHRVVWERRQRCTTSRARTRKRT